MNHISHSWVPGGGSLINIHLKTNDDSVNKGPSVQLRGDSKLQ